MSINSSNAPNLPSSGAGCSPARSNWFRAYLIHAKSDRKQELKARICICFSSVAFAGYAFCSKRMDMHQWKRPAASFIIVDTPFFYTRFPPFSAYTLFSAKFGIKKLGSPKLDRKNCRHLHGFWLWHAVIYTHLKEEEEMVVERIAVWAVDSLVWPLHSGDGEWLKLSFPSPPPLTQCWLSPIMTWTIGCGG